MLVVLTDCRHHRLESPPPHLREGKGVLKIGGSPSRAPALPGLAATVTHTRPFLPCAILRCIAGGRVTSLTQLSAGSFPMVNDYKSNSELTIEYHLIQPTQSHQNEGELANHTRSALSLIRPNSEVTLEFVAKNVNLPVLTVLHPRCCPRRRGRR